MIVVRDFLGARVGLSHPSSSRNDWSLVYSEYGRLEVLDFVDHLWLVGSCLNLKSELGRINCDMRKTRWLTVAGQALTQVTNVNSCNKLLFPLEQDIAGTIILSFLWLPFGFLIEESLMSLLVLCFFTKLSLHFFLCYRLLVCILSKTHRYSSGINGSSERDRELLWFRPFQLPVVTDDNQKNLQGRCSCRIEPKYCNIFSHA